MLRRTWLVCVLAMALAAREAWAAPVKLTVALLDDVATAEPFEELARKFEAEHPGIEIEYMLQFREDWHRLAVQLAGGVGPDIIAGYGVFSGHVIANDALLDLTPYIDRDNLRELVEDFAPAAIEPFIVDGKIYGFPKYTATGAMYFNTDMLDAAGIPYPDGAWTWDEFREIAAKLTVYDGNRITRWGYNLNNMWTWIYPWFYAAGADFSDPYHVPLASPEAYAAGRFLQEMQQSGALLFRFGQFGQRLAAMISSGSWELTWMAAQLPLGIAPMPTGPAGKATQMNNDIIGINKNTRHPEEAWAFLRWLYSEPVQREFLEITGWQPARRSLGFDWVDVIQERILSQGGRLPAGDVGLFFEATAYARHEPMFAEPQVIADHIMPALQRVILAGAPVESFFDEAARAANAVLAERRK